ncbi:hypothetical protein SJ05684_c17950 [Sinorhizobium sojae CCBAU 05684]|uniref:Uncharacterized protein n=1 Tax=Sinorhizobium sojae CCBAU 05684 TaxID=716928 RepID=A0A249PBZ9_9HYPH|nr:hypothetical protein SJ05684_c17950 [Sinorhizobium sojae CCBAU 05684]
MGGDPLKAGRKDNRDAGKYSIDRTITAMTVTLLIARNRSTSGNR